MGVLLDRARKMFGGGAEEPPPAEPFELACACGQRLNGARSDHRQFLRCPGCGQLLFVMPESCYPVPSLPPGVVPRWPDAEADAADERTDAKAKAVVVEERPPGPPVGARLREGLKRAGADTAAGLRSLKPPARWFSPVRLLLFGVVAAIAGTAVVTVYLGRRSGLAQELAAARDASLAAVNKGDFKEARRRLDRAVKSLERYGAGDRAYADFEQFAREVAIFAELMEPTLETLIDDVRSMTAERAATHVRESLRSPTLILEAGVRTAPGVEPGSPQLDAKLLVGTELARVETADLTIFRRLPEEMPSRVLFGARVRTIERGQADVGWVIRLEPDSGVWITSTTCLEKIGWPVDDATRTILEAQGKWVLEKR